jgi:hypothetical protein
MRFWAARDYATAISINKELINTVIDTVVIIYKINVLKTKTNVYGESSSGKQYNRGVRVPCLIRRDNTNPTLDGMTISTAQNSDFYFLRKELQDRNIYPEVGDIIEFHDNYFEIVNANETQLVAGQVQYNHCIICSSVLTRQPAVALDKPLI